MKNKDRSSSCYNNCRRQSSKHFCNFCKHFSHSIETCYRCNKLAVSISASTVTNTESVQPMAPISAQSKSSERTFTMSTDELKNIIANVIHMVGNVSYSSSLSALSGMSPSSWLMDSACCNYMTPHSSLFSELKLVPHPLNICTANGSTMSGNNIGSVLTSNLLVPEVFNVPDLSYNLFSVGQLAELGYHIYLIILGVLCRNLGLVPELDICFPWTTFIFHLLLLFLLLQLLQFLQFLPLHFGMLDLVMLLPLEYNNWLLKVC